MNSVTHLISVLLGIGAFFGFPHAPIAPPPVSLPGLTQPATTTSFSTFSPLLPEAYSTSSPANIQKSKPKTPAPNKKQKVPTLAIQAPVFVSIPLAEANQQAPTSSAPVSPDLPTIPATPSTPPPVQTPPPLPISSNLEGKVIAASVNIYCTAQSGNTVIIITGSGTVIDPRGVILTNAHVADHVLLDDIVQNPNAECVIRKGSPAVAFYKTALLYISPSWIKLHGGEINNSYQAQETGEGDYALLAIAGPVSGQNSLPSSFSSLPVDTSTNSLAANTAVMASGYPAGNLSGSAVVKNLLIQTANLNIAATYTFADGGLDLIRTDSTSLAQRGASGGGVFNQSGQLIGLIATTVPSASNPGLEDLQALTLSYINADLRRNTGKDLASFLSRDLSSIASDFQQNSEPSLANYLPH